jgi:hypothetical protein
VADLLAALEQRLELVGAQVHVEAAALQHHDEPPEVLGGLDAHLHRVLQDVAHPLGEDLGGEAVQHEPLGVRGEDRDEVELRVQAGAHGLRRDEHPQEQGGLARQVHPVAAQHPDEVAHQVAHPHLVQGLVRVAAQQDRHVPLELLLVDVQLLRGHPEQPRGDPPGVLLHHAEHQGHQVVPELVGEGAHHPEVDDGDPPAGLHEEVAGVGIRVEEAVLEDHPADGLGRVHGQQVPVEPGVLERGVVVDLDAPDPLHREDPGGGGLPEDLRDVHPGVAHEVLGHPLGVARLREVVQLVPQGLGELVGETHEVEVLHGRPVGGQQLGQLREDLEVAVDLLDDAGAAHLHDDVHPLVDGRVRLADRARGEGHGVDLGEDVLRRGVGLRLDHRPDLLRRHRGRVVLQPGQLLHVPRRQQVRPGRDDLAELHERGTELLEGLPQVDGLAVELVGVDEPDPGQRCPPLLLDPAEGEAEAVLREDLEDLEEAFPAADHRRATPVLIRAR